MRQPIPPQRARQALRDEAEHFVEEFLSWNESHPTATLSQIEALLEEKRRHLMRRVLEVAVSERGSGHLPEGVPCPDCGRAMTFKGDLPRTLETREATATLHRAYYYCDHCQCGLFPPRPSVGTSGEGTVEPESSLGCG